VVFSVRSWYAAVEAIYHPIIHSLRESESLLSVRVTSIAHASWLKCLVEEVPKVQQIRIDHPDLGLLEMVKALKSPVSILLGYRVPVVIIS
jgi:hypothetical protein